VSGRTGCHGRGFKSFSDFILFKTYSNLIQSKTCLPNLQNFKLKYGAVGFEIWNDFPYSNFFIFVTPTSFCKNKTFVQIVAHIKIIVLVKNFPKINLA
jgi:hypothetical protein